MSENIKIVVSQKGTIPVYTSTRVGGESEVYHDDSLSGKGTHESPIGLSQEILDKISHGGDTFVFEFDASATSWIIQHNLGKEPSVTVVDSAGTEITCSKRYINLNEIELKFNAAFKGKAYLN